MLKDVSKISFLLYMVSLFTVADNSVLYVISNGLFLLFLLISLANAIATNKIVVNEVIITLLVFVVYAFISCLWSIDISNSIIRIVTLLQLFMMMFCVYTVFAAEECCDFFAQCLWISGVILILVFLINYPIGDIIESYSIKERLGEKIGPLNAVARNLAYFVIISIYNALFRKKWYHVFAGLLGLAVLSATQSRTAIILVMAGCGVLVWHKLKNYKYASFFFIGAICLLCGALAQTEIFQKMFWRVYKFVIFLNDTTNSTVDYSAYERLRFIKEGVEFFLANPLKGYGIAGGYALYGGGYENYFHNNYIQILVECGLIGFSIYYGALFILLYRCMKYKEQKSSALALALIVSILVGDIVNSTYYHKFTFLFIGMTVSLVGEKGKET